MATLFEKGFTLDEFLKWKHYINYDALKKWYYREYGKEFIIDTAKLADEEKLFMVMTDPTIYYGKHPTLFKDNINSIAKELTLSNYKSAMSLICQEFTHAVDKNKIQMNIITFINQLVKDDSKISLAIASLDHILHLLSDKQIKQMFDDDHKFTRIFMYMVCASDGNYVYYIDLMDRDDLSDDLTNLNKQLFKKKYNLAYKEDDHLINILFLRNKKHLLRKLDSMEKLDGTYHYGALNPMHIATYFDDMELKSIALKYSNTKEYYRTPWLKQFVPLYMIRLGSLYIENLLSRSHLGKRDIIIHYPSTDKLTYIYHDKTQVSSICNITYKSDVNQSAESTKEVITIYEATNINITRSMQLSL